MAFSAAGRRVVIIVEPRLLADTLSRAVARGPVDVVIAIEGAAVEGPFDLAVVRGEVPAWLTAHTVIRLPETERGVAGSITTPRGTQPAIFGDLTALLQALDRQLRVA